MGNKGLDKEKCIPANVFRSKPIPNVGQVMERVQWHKDCATNTIDRQFFVVFSAHSVSVY